MRILRSLTVAVLCAVAAFAASLDGKWTGPLENAEGRPAVFNLKQDGSKITGSMAGPEGQSFPISDGSLNGDTVAFTVASEWEGNPIKLLVKGKLDGDTLRITISTEGGEWSSDAVLKKADK